MPKSPLPVSEAGVRASFDDKAINIDIISNLFITVHAILTPVKPTNDYRMKWKSVARQRVKQLT